jgi:hypothetical protein
MEETLKGVPVSFSASSASWNVRFAQGGKSAGQGQLAANHPHGMHEREPVGILARLQRRFMHHHVVRAVPPVTLRRVDTALVGTARQIRVSPSSLGLSPVAIKEKQVNKKHEHQDTAERTDDCGARR